MSRCVCHGVDERYDIDREPCCPYDLEVIQDLRDQVAELAPLDDPDGDE